MSPERRELVAMLLPGLVLALLGILVGGLFADAHASPSSSRTRSASSWVEKGFVT